MKKIIFRLVSVFAITAVMLVNLQFLETVNNSELNLSSLRNLAYAFGEDSGGADESGYSNVSYPEEGDPNYGETTCVCWGKGSLECCA